MRPTVEHAAFRRAGLVSAVAFWAAAVMFVADLSVLSGWVSAAPPVDTPPGTVPVTAPTAPATTAPTSAPAPRPAPTQTGTPAVEPVVQRLDTGVQVLFPASPQRSEQLIEIGGTPATLVLYSFTTPDGAHFSVGIVEYPPQIDLSDPAVNLLGSVSGAAGAVGGRIVKRSSVLVGDAPAITYEIEARSVRLRGRNVLDGRHLYSQSVAFQGAPPPHTRDFFSSFRLPQS